MNTHEELINGILNPLVDFMDKEGYSYMIVAGKDGVCSQYANGQNRDLSGMLTALMQKHPGCKKILINSLVELEEEENNIQQ